MPGQNGSTDGPTDDLRRHGGPHVFVEDLAAPTLADDDRHHLRRALRLRDGDPLTICDTNGRWCPAEFGDTLTVVGPTNTVDEPAWPVAIAVALTKASKPELVVQKATELGVDQIVLFHSDRSVPRWDAAKRAKMTPRLERIVREAGMQSRRVRLPAVAVVDDLAAVVELVAARHINPLALADFEGVPVGAEHRTIAIGPEGGWSDEERDAVADHVDLGATVLRAETAAIAAAVHLTSWRH